MYKRFERSFIGTNDHYIEFPKHGLLKLELAKLGSSDWEVRAAPQKRKKKQQSKQEKKPKGAIGKKRRETMVDPDRIGVIQQAAGKILGNAQAMKQSKKHSSWTDCESSDTLW